MTIVVFKFPFSTTQHEESFRNKFDLQFKNVILYSQSLHGDLKWKKLLLTHKWMEDCLKSLVRKYNDPSLGCIQFALWIPSKGKHYFPYIINEDDYLWVYIDTKHDYPEWIYDSNYNDNRLHLRTRVFEHQCIRKKEMELCLLEHLNISDLCNMVLFDYCGFLNGCSR